MPVPAVPEVGDAVPEAVGLGEARAREGGLVRNPEKKYAYAPPPPSTKSAARAAIGIHSLRDMSKIVHQPAGSPL